MDQYQLLIISIVMGIITFIFGTASSIPQIISLVKTRNSSGISLWSWIICIIDNIFWIVWSFGFYFNGMLMYSGNWLRLYQISLLILIFAYTFGSILVSSILIIKISHLIKCKTLKVTELQLAKILLDKDKKKYFANKKWNNFLRYLPLIIFITLDVIVAFTVVAILYVFAYIQPVTGTKEWVWVIVISFICSVIWEITCWPQLIKSIREKDMTGISLFWSIFMVVNCVVNFIYDLSLSFGSGQFNWDVVFVLIFSAIAPNVGILVLKLININKAKKAKMTELEYTKKVLIPQVKAKQAKKKSLHK